MSHSDPSCLFCKIIKGQIPSHKIAETEKAYAFLDINPLSEGHCLYSSVLTYQVIPKYHCEKLHELPPEEMADIGPLLVKVARAVGATDYNLLQNNGSIAHQVVKHVHFHLIPKPDAVQGLGIKWPAGETDHAKFGKLATTISGKL